jgi:hypothetical protein
MRLNTRRVPSLPIPRGPKPSTKALTGPDWGSGAVLATQRALALPFDLARALYAEGARVGFVRKSMIAGCAVDQALARAELCMLGPWARQR